MYVLVDRIQIGTFKSENIYKRSDTTWSYDASFIDFMNTKFRLINIIGVLGNTNITLVFVSLGL